MAFASQTVAFYALLAGALLFMFISAHRVYQQYNDITKIKRESPSEGPDVVVNTIRNTIMDESKDVFNVLIKTTPNIDYESWLREMDNIQRERQEVLRDACHKYANQSFMTLEDFARDPKNLVSLIYSDKYKVIYNFVHKVASQHLVQLFNKKKYQYSQHRLYKLKYNEVIRRLRKYKKFIFVRDPFVRFISVYRNKFIEHPDEPQFKTIAKSIISKYRSTDVSKKQSLKFPEFLQYLTGHDPRRRLNTHWISYLKRNKVCLMKHDFIGKLETMKDDSNYLSKEMLGLKKSIIQGPRPNTTTGHNVLINTLYSQVPKKTIRELVGFYEADFKLFGYNSSINNL